MKTRTFASRVSSRAAVIALLAASAAFLAGCGKIKDKVVDGGNAVGKAIEKVKIDDDPDGEKEYRKGEAYLEDRDFMNAAICFANAGEKNHGEALFKLALCYINGKGVPEDEAKGFELYRKSGEAGNVKGKFAIVADDLQKHRISNETALRRLLVLEDEMRVLAESGDHEAEGMYGILIYLKITEADSFEEMMMLSAESERWIEKAQKSVFIP